VTKCLGDLNGTPISRTRFLRYANHISLSDLNLALAEKLPNKRAGDIPLLFI